MSKKPKSVAGKRMGAEAARRVSNKAASSNLRSRAGEPRAST